MVNIDDIRKINDEKIEEIQNEQVVDIQKLAMYTQIKDILKDDAIFFKLSSNDALNLLSKFFEKEKLKEVYISLISADTFMKLRKEFKI